MNERMIELYEEAAEFAYKICKDEGRTSGPTDHIWNTLSTGKFAELIVRECIQVVDDMADPEEDSDRYVWALHNASEKIKQHFGVK